MQRSTLHRIQAAIQSLPVGIRHMLLAALFFSIMSVLVKMASVRLPSSHTVMARGVVTLVMSLIALRRAGISPWGNDKKRLFLRGAAGFIGLNCFYHSLKALPLADATVIQYLNPVFTVLLAAVFLGERTGLKEVACIVISLVGVVLVVQPQTLFGGRSSAATADVLIALGGAVASAVAYVTVRTLRKTDAPEVVIFYFPLVAVPLSIPPLLRDLTLPTAFEWLLLLAIGITTQLAQMFMTRGLGTERAGRATAVSYSQVVFAYAWGMILFGEFPTLMGILGTLLIAGSIVALALEATPRPSRG